MIRPLWVEFPDGESDLFGVDDQFMVGSSIMVKPVTSAGQTTTEVILPGEETWYDAETHAPQVAGRVSIDTPLGKMPTFFRAGQIVPRRDRPRRNTVLMQHDPFTLVVTVNKAGTASGSLYLDDGKTFEHKEGKYAWRQLSYAQGKLQNSVHPESKGTFQTAAVVERIIVLGLSARPSGVRATVGTGKPAELESVWNSAKSELVIRKPGMGINEAWEISITA